MTVKPEDIKTVVALLRVSTEVQQRDGYSLQAQERARDRDCRTFGWRCLATYEGHETGSALSQRRIIHDLIAFVRDHRPDAVWVIEQSRLTRGDELDVAMLLRELRESGTKVVTERGHVLDPDDLEGAFHFRLKALMDRREWEIIRARNKRGKDEKAKRGLLVNARPGYGYTTTGDGRDTGLRVPIPDEAQVVRQIFEWAASGISIRRISRRLHEQGIPAPTQSGRKSGMQPSRFKDGIQIWAPTTLKRMLRNPMYRGVSFRHCWIRKEKRFVFDPSNPNAIWIEDAHEAIVPTELWEEVQRQLDRRTTATSLSLHMLTGILICPLCGRTFQVTVSHDGRGHANTYYFCKSKRNREADFGSRPRTGHACAMRWLPLHKTDALIWDRLVCLISAPSMVEQYINSASASRRRSAIQDEITRLEESATKIDAMMARARGKLLSEILTDGEYLKERERLEAQLKGMQKQIVTKRREAQSMCGDVARQVLNNLAMLKLGDKKLSRDQRSRLFHSLVRRVIPRDVELRRIEIELYVAPVTGDAGPVNFSNNAPQEFGPVVATMALPLMQHAG